MAAKIDLRYPSGQLTPAGKNASDYILFSIFEYDGGAVTIGKETFALQTTRKKGDAITTIALPIQSGIQDSNNCDWSEDRLDFIKGSAAGVGLEFVKEGNALNSVSAILKASETKGAPKALGKAVSTALIEGALNANLRSRFQGEVMNPNLELLFNGPQLRTFSFSFFMSARDETEATKIKQIIKAFKKNMAPKSKQSLFLKTPNIFEIKYINGSTGQEHQSLNQIKTCALQSCNVTYTPSGPYSTFDDAAKTMTAYKLDLMFGELDPIYDSDYDNPKKPHLIGF